MHVQGDKTIMAKKRVSFLEWGILLLFFLPAAGIVWVIGAGIYHVGHRLLHRQPLFLRQPAPFFFLTLIFASIGACIQSWKPIYLLVPIMILGYLGVYLYTREEDTAWKSQNFRHILIVGSLYMAIVGQIQLHKGYVYGGNWWLGILTGMAPLGLEESGRLFGSAYNPNFTAFILLLGLASLIANILQTIKSEKKQSLFFFVYIGLMFPIMLAIVQTGSRTGVAIMVLLLTLFAWKVSRLVAITLGTVSCILLAYTGTFSSIIPRFDSMVQSFETRQTIWKYSIQVWNNSPFFGVTPLGFQQAYAAFEKTGITHAHNLFLGFFCEYGVIGGTAFLLFTGSYLYKGIKLFVISKWKEQQMAFFFFTLPVLPLTGILDHPLISPQTALIAIMLLGSWERAIPAVQHDSIPNSFQKSLLCKKQAEAASIK
jgi:O-antigen ligase